MSSELILTKKSTASVATPTTNKVTIFVDSSDGITKQKDETGAVKPFNQDISAAITAHESAVDPHPQYETSAEAQAKVDAHATLTNNPHAVTKAQVGLGNCDNTSDLNKPISTATQTALNLKYDASNPAGYQTAAQVNSAIQAVVDSAPAALDTLNELAAALGDDANFASTVTTALAGKQPLDGDLTAVAALAGAGFAVRTTTNTWATRSLTTPVGSGLAITNQDGVFGSPAFTNTDKGSTAVTTHEAAVDPHPQYETSAEAQAKVDAHANLTNNPHAVTKAQVGLGNCDNTSDLNKPVSTATQTALNGKANLVGGNTFTGNQQINDGNLVLRDENTAGDPHVWVIGSGGAGNKVGYRFTPFFGRTGGHAAEVGAIDDGNSSAHLLFYTAPTGTATSILERGRFNNDGSFGVGVGAVNNASALVQIDSTTKGFLMPRMTTAQMEAIASPAVGLKIFNTTLNTQCIYNGTTWTFEYSQFTTTTQATSSTTYANITELVSADLPAGRYQVYFTGTFQSTSTTEGIGLRLSNGTATVGAVVMDWSFAQAGNGTDKNFDYTQIATGSNFTSASATVANGDLPMSGFGIIQLNTAGTLAVQIRAETGLGASVSIRANSVITYRRIS